YRPRRDAKMASKAIRNDLYRGAWSVVEIDFRSYFTTIPHDKLMILIKQRVVDGSMLRLIKQSLTVEIAYEGKVEPTTVGVPQGSPISPLYSNIYLNLLDQVWHRRGYPEKLGATLHRYADDGILVCRKDATQALQAFEGIALRMGLTINREKTRITKLTEGFDFIGFQFVKRRSPNSASDSFRRLQRFINTRFRRYLNYRSKGRGFGWKKYPNAALYTLGIIYIGSGVIRYEGKSAHAVGRRLSDRRPRENGPPGGWGGKGAPGQD